MASETWTGWIVEAGTLDWASARADRLLAAEAVPLPAEGGGAAAGAESAAFLKSKLGGMRGAVSMGLPLRDMLIRVVHLPSDDPAEIPGMARLQADKLSPFPPESAVVSHEILGRSDSGFRVLIAMASEEKVNAAAALPELAGRRIGRVDAAALGRWGPLRMAGAVEPEGRRIAVLRERGGWDLLVYQHGEPLVLRPLDVGEDGGPAELAAGLASEITYALMAAEMDHGAGAASSLAIWHQGSSDGGLAGQVGRLLRLPSEPRPISSLASPAEGLARRALDRSGGRLDLTPDSWLRMRRRQGFRARLLGAAAAVAAVWALAAGTLFLGPYIEGRRLRALEAFRTAQSPAALEVRNLRRRVIQLERYGQGSARPLDCLREVSAVQPQGVLLTSFSYKKDESLKIGGESADVNLVYEYKNKLDSSGLFAGSSLQGPLFDRQRGKNTFEIELVFPGVKE